MGEAEALKDASAHFVECRLLVVLGKLLEDCIALEHTRHLLAVGVGRECENAQRGKFLQVDEEAECCDQKETNQHNNFYLVLENLKVLHAQILPDNVGGLCALDQLNVFSEELEVFVVKFCNL